MSGLANAFNTYQSKTGGTLDSATGLLSITSTQYSNLQSLTFNIGVNSYELTPNAQIWLRSLNTAIGGTSGAIYLVVSDIGTPSGSGLDFINGYTFLCVYFPFSLTSIYYRWCLCLCILTASATTARTTLPMAESALPVPNIPTLQQTKSRHCRRPALFHLRYLSSMRSLSRNLKLSEQGRGG